MERWIMHVDMDAFYASIEQRDHPEYRGLPVIVGGQSRRGVVATASYEARKFGVHSAMPMTEARRRCPGAIFLSGNHALYRRVSAQLYAIFRRFAPVVERLALDEAFLDVSGMQALVGDLKGYAKQLKASIRSEVGLVASVGLAPNKFLAKLASDFRKPDGLVVIGQQEGKAFVRDLPIEALWGVGEKTAAALRRMGYERVGMLSGADPARLAATFGVLAHRIVALSNAEDDRPVEDARLPHSIGNEITFDEDLCTRAEAERVLLALSEKVGWRLRTAGYAARCVTIKVRYASFQTITRSKTLVEPTHFDEVLYETAVSLLGNCSLQEGIRLLGITGGQLCCNEQNTLFDEENARRKALYAAVDGLRDRFGRHIVQKAKLLEKKQ